MIGTSCTKCENYIVGLHGLPDRCDQCGAILDIPDWARDRTLWTRFKKFIKWIFGYGDVKIEQPKDIFIGSIEGVTKDGKYLMNGDLIEGEEDDD